MELEELKNSWNLLDERLKKEEYNQNRMLDKILKKERKSAYNKLVNYEFKIALMCLIFIPFIALRAYGTNTYLHGFPSSETLCVLMALSFIWQVVKITYLLRKDIFKQTVIQSLRKITKYKKWIQFEFYSAIAMACVLFPFLTYLSNIRDSLFYFFMAFMFIFTLSIVTIPYLRIQMKNIREIQENLKEAKEFEQEE